MEFDEVKKSVLDIVSNKKFQWVAVGVLFLIVLVVSSSIRMSNWDLLTDSTTGKKIPLALDPFYFLRIAETIAENDGVLPEVDVMRISGLGAEWSLEIMPRVVVGMWKASNTFGDYTLREVDVASPVVFYIVGLILFFLLSYVLTKSKLISILASSLLAFTPPFLYRTMAGFSDHEAIGIMAFFAMIISLTLAFNYLDKEKVTYGKVSLYALFVGLTTAFTIAAWGGVAVFIFMIVPVAFLLFWIIKTKEGDSFVNSGILFYGLWIILSIIFAWVFGSSPGGTMNRFLLSSTGLLAPAVLAFILIDKLFIMFGRKINLKYYDHNKRIFYSIGILVLVGIVGLPVIGKNFFSLAWEVLNRLLNPLWGSSRLDTTVAENAQPYLRNWIASTGKMMFSLFVGGLVFIGIGFADGVKSLKDKILITLGFIAMTFGILFSRISPVSMLNGNGIFSLSGLMYVGGIVFFGWVFFRIYFKEKIKLNPSLIIIFSWMLVMIVIGRATTRLFFVIAPFVCFSEAYLVGSVIEKMKRGGTDDVVRILVIGLVLVSVVVSGMIISDSYNSISNQAKYTGPSANVQWQSAMSWVRENTSKDSIFAHWWDYGYWVQTLGERATIADGGHAQGRFNGDHKIGRYILTTPVPESALSFFKTADIDYLLIDQTDLGKYPAYSKIGGGDGEDYLDRYASIPVMPSDARQTRETANGTMIVFSGGTYIFEDIVYEGVFLPSEKAAIVGVVLTLDGDSLRQPVAVYIYNNVQTRIPIRYLYFGGKILDFENGLDAVIDIIPSFDGQQINQMGAAIYLSQKVSRSLFAQLFLMDDPFDNYDTIELVHTEPSPIVASMKAQGVQIRDFIYYQGFRGPIKIWNVQNIPEDIKVVEEFLTPEVGFATLDWRF